MSGTGREAYSAALEAFIREKFQVGDNDPYFDHNVSLWEEGYVDSSGVVEVIAFIEDTFDVAITDEILFSPDFATIAGMSKLIMELKEKPKD